MTGIVLSALSRQFGGLMAVDALSLTVEPGEVVSLIGPNGAGKTTAINLVSGYYRPTAGQVFLAGRDVTALAPHERARAGLQRTFQNLQVCFNMSARENVMLGAHQHLLHGVLTTLLRPRRVCAQTHAAELEAEQLLVRVGLGAWSGAHASEMPYGALKRLEIARALAAEPRFLLLDEPVAGLNPSETAEMGALIRSIAAAGVAVLLVEHDMKLVMSISARVVVLNFGRRIAAGSPEQVRQEPEVIRAYLGQGTA